jgi:hypothetical protein
MASFRTLARVVVVRALLAFALSSAATAVSSPARAGSASPSAADKAKAKRAFERGQKLYEKAKLAEAIAAFQESYDAVPDPKALLMVARVQRDNGELLKARASYRKGQDAAEAEGQTHRATLDTIEQELRELDGVLGFINIELSHAPSGTRVSIDGDDVTSQLGNPIRVEPGPLVVTATAPGGSEKSENATVKAGETASITIAFGWSGKSDEELAEVSPDGEQAPPPEKKVEPDPKTDSNTKKTLTWVAGGVGLVGIAVFATFGSLSESKFNHLKDSCPQDNCNQSLESGKNTGKTFQTVANVGLVAGGVGLATALTLFVLGSPSKAASGDQTARAKLEVGLGRVALSGSFQ